MVYTLQNKTKEKNYQVKYSYFNHCIKVQSINDVALHAMTSNNLSCDAIRLGAVYFCDDAHDEMSETMFQGKN